MRVSLFRVAVVLAAALAAVGCPRRPAPAPVAERPPVEIPFALTDQNLIVVNVTVNDSDTLSLMLHTASSDVRVTDEAVRRLKSVRFSDSQKVKSWGGEGDSRVSPGNRVTIGGVSRDGVEFWTDKNSGKDTDGKFGLDFFGDRVVEIDYDRRVLVTHERLPAKAESFERLKIESRNGLLMVPGECVIDGRSYPHSFLLHSGYAGGILLDDAFAAFAGVDGKVPISSESALTDSFGHAVKVKKGILPAIALGRTRLADVPVGFFSGGLGNQKMSVLGCDVLVRFHWIVDAGRDEVYLLRRTLKNGI